MQLMDQAGAGVNILITIYLQNIFPYRTWFYNAFVLFCLRFSLNFSILF